MKLRNINPIGQADVPLLYRQGEPFDQHGAGCLEPGEEFDVTEDQARRLLPQMSNYEPADDEARQLLDDLAAEAQQEAETALAQAEHSTPLASTPAADITSTDGSDA